MTPKTEKVSAPKPQAEERRHRLTREGIVIGDKMHKTIVVQVTRLMQHPQFEKIVRNKIKYLVHDENNEAKVGNKVRIVAHKPISRRKRWKLVKVLS